LSGMKRKMISVGFLVLWSAAVSARSRVGVVTGNTHEEYESMCGTAAKRRAETIQQEEMKNHSEWTNRLMAEYASLMESVQTGWNVSIGEASAHLHDRCSRFEADDLEHEKFVFTHIPKAGGQSMQVAISEEARFHKVDEKNLYMGHIRLGNVFEWFKGSKDTRSTDYVTMLREPSAIAVSDYNYMRRMKNHNNHKVVSSFRSMDDWLISKTDDGGPGGLSLLVPWGPSSKLLNKLRGFCSWTRRLSQEWRCLCSDLWREVLDRSAEVLAQRYTAVGLLERMEDSLEVMRCRVPWLHTLKEIPRHNARPGKAASKKPRRHHNPRRGSLLQKKTFLQNGLYEFASKLLDADLKCCRRRAKKERRLSRYHAAQHTTHKGSSDDALRIQKAVQALQLQQQNLTKTVQQLLVQQQLAHHQELQLKQQQEKLQQQSFFNPTPLKPQQEKLQKQSNPTPLKQQQEKLQKQFNTTKHTPDRHMERAAGTTRQ